jgi:translation initiation factor 2B subunit (eIF-2B alpha/beta/delta family)
MTDFANDRTSGSTDVALAFLTELERWIAIDRSASAAAFRGAVLTHLRFAQGAHPTLALIHQLCARALDVVDSGVAREERPADLRAHLEQSCAVERADVAAARSGVVQGAVQLLTERETWITTLSTSAAVRDAFLLAQKSGRAPRALIGEGRPRLEGRSLAQSLAAAGIPVWLVADAALPMLLSQTGMVWIGADAVTEHGVLNKIGSFATALAAREHSVPVYALADRRKFIPAATPALRIVEQPADEVWEDPAPGVRPRNVYFELVPMTLVRGIVVEDGVLGATEAATVARERPLPDELAATPD